MLSPVSNRPNVSPAPFFAAPAIASAPARRPVDLFETQAVTTAAARPADGFKAYEELSDTQRSLLGEPGAEAWNDLTSRQRGVFLLITDRLQKQGFDLTGMKLQGGVSGINNEGVPEIVFDKPSAQNLKSQVEAKIASGDYLRERPNKWMHANASEGARENRSKFALQIGFGENGAFVDMDRYNPLTSKLNYLKHLAEIAYPGKLGPEEAARALGADIFSRL